MDVLESREAALRAKVLGDGQRAPPATTGPLVERLRGLQAQLDSLSGAVSGAAKLRELYQEHADQLQLQPASTFARSSTRAGDELKRATILSSADQVQRVAAQLQQLQQLSGVLDQLRAPDAGHSTRLAQLEAAGELQSERALALHGRVERLLATYQQMMLVLSEKCVEYNTLLDQLQV